MNRTQRTILTPIFGAVVLACVLLLTPAFTRAAPISFNGVRYQAIMVAPNYPGGPTFDDNLALSRAAADLVSFSFEKGLSEVVRPKRWNFEKIVVKTED